mmetsp:Transcript_88704/g.171767  ORF Transcript_88704/g.171767 Transcript_88704/m.171767 type:complete len:581 (-) Transcript_88704:44-1786(-)
MALYASKGYNVPRGGGAAGMGSFEEAENLSAYYNDDDAQFSDFGGEGADGESAYSRSSYGSSSFASSRTSAASTTVSSQLKIRGPGKAKGSNGFFDSFLDAIAETSAKPVEASASDQARLQDYWHNYDIAKSLKPKLLPDEDFERAQTILYSFRISYAKLKKREIKVAKEQAIQHFYALKIQCAARLRFARTVRRRREALKEREEDAQVKYVAFKAKLVQGINLKYCDAKAKQMKDCTIKVNLAEPKLLAVTGPKLSKPVKFELMFLYKVHSGWGTATLKELPREVRPSKETTLSLEGKTTLDFGTVGSNEDAKYDREEFSMCFKRLAQEMNSPASIYRDAKGNRVRVVKSVFEPLSGVTLTSAKDNKVALSGKNIASLYKIQHRFTRHKQKIVKNDKARKGKAATTPGNDKASHANNDNNGGKGGKGKGGKGGKKDAYEEVAPRASGLSDLSLMTDEAEYADDPSRWAKNSKGKGQGLGQTTTVQSEEEEAAAAKAAILKRRQQGGGGRKDGGGDNSDGSDDYDSEDDEDYDSEEDDDDSDEEDGFDDQATYTDYTESRVGVDGRNSLLEDSDESEADE